jgi:lysophospholipase L1-like esterase
VIDRRAFLTAAAAIAGGVTSLSCRTARPGRVLFQGDSITAAGRRAGATGHDADALGMGYPLTVAGALAGGPWAFFNRAVSGNTVPDLQARWPRDTLALEPDVLSVLVGVNDFWHREQGYAGTVGDFERQYSELLAATRRAGPGIRLLVLEPFVLRCGAVNDSWFPEFDERRRAAARVASSMRATFVPLQAAFDHAAAGTSPEHWAPDGVHPSPQGHQLIARQWLSAFAAGENHPS